jgi:hypothetical protein
MKLKQLFKTHKTGELVVKRRYSSRVKLFVAGAVVLVAIISAGAIYNYGLSSQGVDTFAMFQRQSALRGEIKRLKDENLELRETLARAQRTLQMDKVAYQDLQRKLEASSQDINKLREELSFYRNIISPPNKVGGLQIERLNIERVGQPADSVFRYKLVLLQALKHDHTIYGRVRLEVRGAQGGKDATLAFPGAADKPHNVAFKYFQEFEGVMKLPQNFQPVGVKVSITTTSPAAQTLEQNYDWPKL